MGVCCVDGCEADDKEDITYFPVPVAPALRRKWREAIKPSVKLHQDSRICSKHFHTDDYEKVRGKFRLKGRVVPSVFDKKECTSPIPSADTNVTNGALTSDDARNGGGEENGGGEQNGGENEDGGEPDEDSAAMHVDVELSVPEFDLLQTEIEGDVEDSLACTIECVPEAILHEESDSNSETELHKEDIEDIIANYHIQQHSKLNNSDSKLNNSDTGGKEKEKEGEKVTDNNKEKEKTSTEKQDTNKKQGLPPDKHNDKQTDKIHLVDDDDDDLIEVGAVPGQRPEFIEISVDIAGGSHSAAPGSEPGTDDCMMLLENVQVDIDPAALMLAQQQDDSDDDVMETTRKEDPISLLTSSDESDVILEEPHIDTVEVSSEDEDDKPLVALVKSKAKPTKLTRMLWGNLTEYYCYQCKFTTLSKSESERHKLQHSNSNNSNSKILFVCEVCNFTCASKSMFSKHKKRHKEEKRFKCKYCEYKARHSMSLVYHMKSHENIHVDTINVDDITIKDIRDKFKCSDCRFVTSSRKEIIRHASSCGRGQGKVKVKLATHFCDLCSYSTKRNSDLKRHRERKHLEVDDDYED